MTAAPHVWYRLLLLWLLLAGSMAGYGQASPGDTTITLTGNNISLTEVFKAIRKQTGLKVMFAQKDLNEEEKVSVHFLKTSLPTVLSTLFKEKSIEWVIKEDVIILRPKAKSSGTQSMTQQHATGYKLSGKVINENNEPVAGASITLEANNIGATSNESGDFVVETKDAAATLLVSSVGYESQQIKARHNSPVTVHLTKKPETLQETEVVYSGFQKIPKERAAGSFVQVNNELLDRTISSNVLDKLKDVTSGLLINGQSLDSRDNISIRGISTIFANQQPLIILDNFPYEYDINSINPNDVESITVLKDASAASIWGARSGNGVIVINTKKGKFGQRTRVSINSNITFTDKPDLSYSPNMSISDYIDVERMLFDKGYYNAQITATNVRPALSPVVEVLLKLRNKEITETEAESEINRLKTKDVRRDYDRYLLRQAVTQRYAANLSGGGMNNNYYISVGYDKDLGNNIGTETDRLTLNANNSYLLLQKRLEIGAGIQYTGSRAINNFHFPAFGGGMLYPYAQLANDDGSYATIDRYRKGYTDTAGNGKLLDWRYAPLQEQALQDNVNRSNTYLLNTVINYKFLKGFTASVKYQYGRSQTEERSVQSQELFSTRDYINKFTQINTVNGSVTRPVPLGEILDFSQATTVSHNLRAELSYSGSWQHRHQLSALAGFSVQDIKVKGITDRLYGYDPERATSLPVDYTTQFKQYIGNTSAAIVNMQDLQDLADRNVSAFANASYTYLNRYTLTASVRQDGSNLFGVNANQQWNPFWSVGGIWYISHEPFYKSTLFPVVKLRATYGYNGNIDKRVTAYLVARTLTNNPFGLRQAAITSPPNKDLQWEQIGILNLAIDFETKNRRIAGTIEYYRKKGDHLIGDAQLAPSSGLTEFRGNTSGIKGEGVDIQLTTLNINRKIRWTTTILFSYARDWVTAYRLQTTNIGDYISGVKTVPMLSRPVTALYSYRWAGLDPLTGDPQGYIAKEISKNYTAMLSSTNLDDLVYNGPAKPPYWGAVRNTLSWKELTASVNIAFAFGHYFRRSSIDYNRLFTRSTIGHKDYSDRWQHPGDEEVTNVPSINYPANANRDKFYQYSEVLVEKGDYIAVQDVRLSYLLKLLNSKRPAFESMELYLYTTNFQMLWTANNRGIDPTYLNLNTPSYGGRPAVRFSAGVKANF